MFDSWQVVVGNRGKAMQSLQKILAKKWLIAAVLCVGMLSLSQESRAGGVRLILKHTTTWSGITPKRIQERYGVSPSASRLFKNQAPAGETLARVVKRIDRVSSTGLTKNDLKARYSVLELPVGVDVGAIIRAYLRNADIENVEIDAQVSMIAFLTNDPFLVTEGSWGQDFADLWGLHMCKIPDAWNTTYGDSDVIVAVVDSGIDYLHEDIEDNLWENGGEIPGNELDDDQNGYVDDVIGYDFTTCDIANANGCVEPKDPGGDVMDDLGHGTHVAGIIGAVGNNNRGIPGVAWGAKIMTLKGLNRQGFAYPSELAEAIIYATDQGADVINLSLGSNATSSPGVLIEAVQYASELGVVVIAAAGNTDQDIGDAATGFWPACFDETIAVGAIGEDGLRAYYSNFGSIDLVAPGGASFVDPSILSLRAEVVEAPNSAVREHYLRQSGTSMAAPHVSGAVALILSYFPTLNPEQVRQRLQATAVDLGVPGTDIYYGHGLLDAAAALRSRGGGANIEVDVVGGQQGSTNLQER